MSYIIITIIIIITNITTMGILRGVWWGQRTTADDQGTCRRAPRPMTAPPRTRRTRASQFDQRNGPLPLSVDVIKINHEHDTT